jgi:hypothetical protein
VVCRLIQSRAEGNAQVLQPRAKINDKAQCCQGTMTNALVGSSFVTVDSHHRLTVNLHLHRDLIGSCNTCSDKMLLRQCQMLANIWFQTGNISTFQFDIWCAQDRFFKCECQMWRAPVTFSTFDI